MSKAIATAKSSKATGKGGNKATVAKTAAKKPASTTVKSAAAETKADKARQVFAECYAMKEVPARKDIIARAMKEAGLSDKGAATYLQNYRKANNMVASA